MGMSVRQKSRFIQECGNEGAVKKQLRPGILMSENIEIGR